MNKSRMACRAIALGAATFCGFNSTLSRLADDTGTAPVPLILHRFLISAAIMILLLASIVIGEEWSLDRTCGMGLSY